MKSHKILLVFLALCFCSSQLLAESLGTLYLEKGKVKLHRNSVDIVYQEPGKMVPIFNQDEIQTGANTRVKIKFSKRGNKIDLYPLTLFKFDDVSKGKNEVSMLTGKARVLIPKKSKVRNRRRTFRVRTANALIGVKGTEFVVGCGDGVTSVLALSGVVSLSNISELDVAVDLKINHTSQVSQAARPTIPIIAPAEIRQTIISGDTTAGFKEIKFGEVISTIQIEKQKKASQPDKSDEASSMDTQTDDPEEDTEDVDVDEELDAIEDSVDEVQEETEEQQGELQQIEIQITN